MPFPDAASLTRRIARRVGDALVYFYPVRAASVGAFLGSGGLATLIDASIDRRPVLGDDGVNNSEVVLVTDSDTATALDFAGRSCSVELNGRSYDIVVVDEELGAVECRLQEIQA